VRGDKILRQSFAQNGTAAHIPALCVRELLQLLLWPMRLSFGKFIALARKKIEKAELLWDRSSLRLTVAPYQ